MAPLRDGVQLIESGQIRRTEINSRLAHYIVPLAVAGKDDARAACAPEFNEAISSQAVLWPHVRARWDAQRVCLVSVERATGWFHDLCLPGYLWADTADHWLVHGLTYHDGMSSYEMHNDRLFAAFQQLQRHETAPGHWSLCGTALPLGDELQKRFPVVGRFVDERAQPTISNLGPDRVAQAFAGIFG